MGPVALMRRFGTSQQRKTEKINVRVDESTRAAPESIKIAYGFSSDVNAIRGLITIAKNRGRLTTEVEG